MQAVDGAYVSFPFDTHVYKIRNAEVVETYNMDFGEEGLIENPIRSGVTQLCGFELVDCLYDRFGFRDVVQYQPGVCLYGEHRPEIRGRIPEFP